MDGTLSAFIVVGALAAGSAVSVGEKLNSSRGYDSFIKDPSSYYLIDSSGNPVSQDLK